MLCACIAVAWLVLDLLTKWWAMAVLRGCEGIVLIPGFWSLTYGTNSGVAFGFLRDHPTLLPWLNLGLLAVMIWMAKGLDWTQKTVAVGAGLVVAGALGNIADRLRFGYVVDFLDFQFFGWHYPTFNIADTGICVGLGLVFFSEWKRGRHE